MTVGRLHQSPQVLCGVILSITRTGSFKAGCSPASSGAGTSAANQMIVTPHPVGGVTISTAPLVSAWLRGTGGRFAAVTQALIGPPRRTLTPEVGGVELVILKRGLWYRCGRLCA
jgi:hypothetical protein